MEIKLLYIRSKETGQYYIGSSYGAAKFSSKKPVSTFMRRSSAERLIKERIVNHYYADEDRRGYDPAWRPGPGMLAESVEIRDAVLTLK